MIIVHEVCIVEINKITKFQNVYIPKKWACVFTIVGKSYNA